MSNLMSIEHINDSEDEEYKANPRQSRKIESPPDRKNLQSFNEPIKSKSKITSVTMIKKDKGL